MWQHQYGYSFIGIKKKFDCNKCLFFFFAFDLEKEKFGFGLRNLGARFIESKKLF